MTDLSATLTATRAATDAIRTRRKALQRSQTEISLYTNPQTGHGLVFRGRLNVLDAIKHDWPKKHNVSSTGYVTVRASHFLAKLIMKIPNDSTERKNVVIRVDRFGGAWRWTGVLHHWKAETKDGNDLVTIFFNEDMQFTQFVLCPPNPLLPIPVFQFPRDYFVFGPTRWCVATTLFLQLIRLEGNLWTLPDDPFDLTSWTDSFDPSSWQVHVKGPSFLNDDSIWTLLAARMNTFDSVIADALDDGQITMTYRRYFTDEGEQSPSGLMTQRVANGALVFEPLDRSGIHLNQGTFFGGNAIPGLERSVLQYASGEIESYLTLVTNSEALYPDEYFRSGWMASLASAPTVCLRDSWWNDLQTEFTHSPSTASQVIVGGDNPTADAIAKLIIESVGSLLGYFLLAGFDGVGEIASEVIMPFIVGTILAWDQFENGSRATQLGWVHLWEIFQQGAENNSWSLSALAVARGGMKATQSETAHTMVIDEGTWLIPGLHVDIGDRMSSTAGVLERNAGIDLLFVNQIVEQHLTGDETGASRFMMKVGQNKASLSQGERNARQLKFALDKLQDIGVHLIS